MSSMEKSLVNYLSLEEILGYLRMIYEIGEKAAGTAEELEAANLIKDEFERIGLENVRLEPFEVTYRNYKSCELRMLQPIDKTIPCVTAGTSLSTLPEGISAELIDAGFGTMKDYERLRKNGVRTEGKVALIERSDRLTYWPDIPCRLANDTGVKAVIFTSFNAEHKAFRKEAFPFPSTPAIYIPYEEAQDLRDILSKNKARVKLKNVIEIDENGVSYNVIGELIGKEYPDEIITVSAHHDSWFGGAIDNAAAVASILEIAKVLKENYKPKRTMRFISFGAEESGSKEYFEWSVGSSAYVKQHHEENERTIANVNIDVPAYGDEIAIRVSPEMASLVEGLIVKLALESFCEVIRQPFHATDQWSFVMAGIPSINFGAGTGGSRQAYEKIYHTNYDTPVNVSRYLLKHQGELILNSILALDSTTILPYDFLSTAETLERDLSLRLGKTRGIIDILTALAETRKLKVLAHEFNKLKKVSSRKKVDVKFINKSQREICSLLNTTILGTGADGNKRSSWIIAEYLDMLITLKTSIEALKSNSLKIAEKSLISLRTMSWGLNVNLRVYNETINLMLDFARYPGIYPNLMIELLSIREKMEGKNINVSKVAHSVERQYNIMVDKVSDKISDLENAIKQSNQKLIKMLCHPSKL